MSFRMDKKLKEKKYRSETGLFLVEGRKGILELVASRFHIERIYVTEEFVHEIEAACKTHRKEPEITLVSEKKLEELGTLDSNNAGVAVARMEKDVNVDALITDANDSFVLVLDDIKDPGNLGTIIRTADWFGITTIAASRGTVDFYNPKVIGASMGSFTRVRVVPSNLRELIIKAHECNLPIYGAFLEGTDVHTLRNSTHGFIVMGSESQGISEELTPLITSRITIPRMGTAESLNVGVATGIILSALKRGGSL